MRRRILCRLASPSYRRGSRRSISALNARRRCRSFGAVSAQSDARSGEDEQFALPNAFGQTCGPPNSAWWPSRKSNGSSAAGGEPAAGDPPRLQFRLPAPRSPKTLLDIRSVPAPDAPVAEERRFALGKGEDLIAPPRERLFAGRKGEDSAKKDTKHSRRPARRRKDDHDRKSGETCGVRLSPGRRNAAARRDPEFDRNARRRGSPFLCGSKKLRAKEDEHRYQQARWPMG